MTLTYQAPPKFLHPPHPEDPIPMRHNPVDPPRPSPMSQPNNSTKRPLTPPTTNQDDILESHPKLPRTEQPITTELKRIFKLIWESVSSRRATTQEASPPAPATTNITPDPTPIPEQQLHIATRLPYETRWLAHHLKHKASNVMETFPEGSACKPSTHIAILRHKSTLDHFHTTFTPYKHIHTHHNTAPNIGKTHKKNRHTPANYHKN